MKPLLLLSKYQSLPSLRKMLAVFEKSVGQPPEELSIPSTGSKTCKTRAEIAEFFHSSSPDSIFFNLSDGSFMALSHVGEHPLHPRSVVVIDDIFCTFIGSLENMADLRHYYGLSRQANEAMLVIELYKVLRDRAPYPSDQVIRDLQGEFAFILVDAKCGTLFAARDRDGGVKLQWGMAADGSLICSDDPNIMSEACGKSCAAFPPGCIFMSGSGLISFIHPLHKVRAIMREDDEGRICAVTFQVDLFTRLHSIPRMGSSANWANPTIEEEQSSSTN